MSKLAIRDEVIYKNWESLGFFKGGVDKELIPYTIMIPPPNITGDLHIGHALTMTLQDILIRWKRMQGYDTLWLPGTDHAGIATQMIVEKELNKQGLSHGKVERNEFIRQVWQWKNKSGINITKQLRCLGASLDWSRERFTLDDKFSSAVQEAFIRLFNDGLIYRDKRLVNWDPKFQSAISDLEVETIETKSFMWYVRYPVESYSGRSITVATTRPETLLGDSAIAVHPSDPRYKDLIGQSAIVPIIGRSIPIIADEYSEIEKGTGAVKITPAHDFSDFVVGQRHNLSMLTILDKEAKITLKEIKKDLKELDLENLSFLSNLEGKSKLAARELLIARLKNLGYLNKIEPHVYQVPHSERTGVVIEPRLTTQWFCNTAKLAKLTVEAVEKEKVKFIPKQWENTFFSWMEDIQPWCISRQLWWGHRIPAWYGPDGKVFVHYSQEQALNAAKKFYKTDDIILTQDEDVLDTWFSSSLWPFATLGWPANTEDLNRYYPTDILITGYDIIFFWVSRMLMMGLYFTQTIPFHTVFIHGLVLDENGQKMSKTKGNTINPLEIIDQYGADTLRWSVCSIAGLERNLRLSNTKIQIACSFLKKINSAINFCKLNNMISHSQFDSKSIGNILCRWLLAEMNKAIISVTKNLDNYRFDNYTESLNHFIRHIFCDWFIEFAKIAFTESKAQEIRETGAFVISVILRLLHPVIPFTTEEHWTRLGYRPRNHLIKEKWPINVKIKDADEALLEVEWIILFLTSIRKIRAEMKIPYSVKIKILLSNPHPNSLKRVMNWSKYIQQITKASEISVLNKEIHTPYSQIIIDEMTVIISFTNLVSKNDDISKRYLEKELFKAKMDLEKLTTKIENKHFISKTPIKVVKDIQDKIQSLTKKIEKLKAILNKIKL